MKYYELECTVTPCNDDNCDILSALLADLGFETFVPTDNGVKAYVQQTFFDESAVDSIIDNFPIPGVSVSYELNEPEDKDWNETWEEQGFEPIVVENKVVVCDTKHTDVLEEFSDKKDIRVITIHPKQAFGTGSHQTTRMLLSTLYDIDLSGKCVVDAGCGTGILGFLCLMNNAAKVLSYDIDEWSVNNTIHNYSLNFDADSTPITSAMDVRLGDSSCLAGEKDFDLLIANINRNILLNDMDRFSSVLKKTGSSILLSGFYVDDIPYLVEATAKHGFTLQMKRTDNEWAMLMFTR